MIVETIAGILIPFLGTSLGAACVFFLTREIGIPVQRGLKGFAAGVMTAASVWSLLIPAMEQSAGMGRFAFIPAVAGFWCGILFLLFLDRVVPHLHTFSDQAEGPQSTLTRTTMLILAVTLHNVPEGMAVGVVFAGCLNGSERITLGSAMALAIGIAIQNFPEGAIISLPMRANGDSRIKSFMGGVLSGAVEPIAALITLFFMSLVVPAMPFLLSLAAGAMIYVVVEELIPETCVGEHSDIGTIAFAIGFSLMMTLDVALG